MKEKKLKLLSEETTAMYCIYKTFSCSHYYCIKKTYHYSLYIFKNLFIIKQSVTHTYL